MQRKQLIPSKFAQSTSRSSGSLPVRTIEVDEIAPLGSNAFEESVRLACVAAKFAEQEELEKIFQKASPGTKDFAYAA
jgi:hypothetical protein